MNFLARSLVNIISSIFSFGQNLDYRYLTADFKLVFFGISMIGIILYVFYFLLRKKVSKIYNLALILGVINFLIVFFIGYSIGARPSIFDIKILISYLTAFLMGFLLLFSERLIGHFLNNASAKDNMQ